MCVCEPIYASRNMPIIFYTCLDRALKTERINL